MTMKTVMIDMRDTVRNCSKYEIAFISGRMIEQTHQLVDDLLIVHLDQIVWC